MSTQATLQGATISPMTLIRSFLGDDRGQGLVEYALIVALISVIALVSLGFLGNKANGTLSNAANTLN